MEVLYKEDLDNLRAGCCPDKIGLEHPLFLHSRCHLEKDLCVSYFNGEMIVKCSKCHNRIVTVAVARQTISKDRYCKLLETLHSHVTGDMSLEAALDEVLKELNLKEEK